MRTSFTLHPLRLRNCAATECFLVSALMRRYQTAVRTILQSGLCFACETIGTCYGRCARATVRKRAQNIAGLLLLMNRLLCATVLATSAIFLTTRSPGAVVAVDARTLHRNQPRVAASPMVIVLTNISATRAARVARDLYPNARVTVDANVNGLIVIASADEEASIRQVLASLDVKNPLAPATQAFALHRVDASVLSARLRPLFPQTRFSQLGARTLIVEASPSDMQQIQTLIAATDTPPNTPPAVAAATPSATEAVRVLQASPRQIAHEVAGAVHGLRVSVAGQSLVLAGNPDLVQRAKDVIAILDVPPAATRYTSVYRIKTLDAASVAALLQRSFPDAKIAVDTEINALSVTATAAEQRRIADGIAQLDSAPATNASGGTAPGIGGPAQIYPLKYALPGQNGAPSTSSTDLANLVTQTLGSQATDLHVTADPNNAQLILTGSPYSVKLAKDLLAQLDVPQRLVVLDTEILEMDENTAKNLGVQFFNAIGGPLSIGTLFTEGQPPPDPLTGFTQPIRRLQPLTRTPISFGASINLAIQHGTARVLADPRITTLSGHTATIRAGDNIAIQLQAGGGAGTIATTQIQTFQTGVTLDITPIVNDDGLITVALHPVVNSLTGILNNIPQISTRDTQTTVALKENETLVIGGLIQDNTQRTDSRVPILGDLPLVGHIFRNETLNGNRNELIITVTPHILVPGQQNVYPGPPLPGIPKPAALPTLPPGTILPASAPSPMPLITPAPKSRRLPSPITVTLETPPPVPANASSTPQSASAPQLNVFVYGSPPPNNNASASDPPRIYFVSFQPTMLGYGRPFNLTATTSSNISQLSLSYNGVSISIPQVGPGQWQAALPFALIGQPARAGAISLSLTASESDGRKTMIPIPVTISP